MFQDKNIWAKTYNYFNFVSKEYKIAFFFRILPALFSLMPVQTGCKIITWNYRI